MARGERHLDLVTMFVPLFRLQCMFQDEQVGEVESYRQRFEKLAGLPVETYLGIAAAGEADESSLPS